VTASIQGVPIKNNPLEKIPYLSKGSADLSQTFSICMRVLIQHILNFIEMADMVQQIQQFKL